MLCGTTVVKPNNSNVELIKELICPKVDVFLLFFSAFAEILVLSYHRFSSPHHVYNLS